MKTNKLFKITLVVVILISTLSILSVRAFVFDPGPGGGGDDPPPDPDYTKPTVSITSPTNGADINDDFTVRATATDNVAVAKVNFYIDGSLKRTDYSSSYTWNVDFSDFSVGSHTLSAKAVDTSGNYKWDSITVTLFKSALIIVESNLWTNGDIQTAVYQYGQDLEDQGFDVLLYVSPISDAEQLRAVLQVLYVCDDINGAVLIGDLPTALFLEGDDLFICDLYLMDLDGTWIDSNSDDIYDDHIDGSGDIEPEIYVGRIDASTYTFGGSNIDNIIDLLDRTNDYRDGCLTRSHKALTYIDDDWKPWADGTYDNWPGWLDDAYPTRTDVYEEAATNAEDWMDRLNDDYEWAHLCAHSWPQGHAFSTSDPEYVTSQQINNIRPRFHFYNLFCCDAADYREDNCLAITYLYSSDYSLAVVASSKSGGMLQGAYFYNDLAGATIGQALHHWFQHIQEEINYKGWFYGMCILGDPFLTI